jgi:uncharacterized protein (TIGR00299 family) protein
VHGVALDDVHFHEVGAVDSIVDLVGAAVAWDWLSPARSTCGTVNVGGGFAHVAHGVLPVPAPATARLLAGIPVYSSGTPFELVTPTGALIVTSYAQDFGPLPAMSLGKAGYGAGSRDVPGRPNLLRLLVGEVDAAASGDVVLVAECEIDDMNPQMYGPLMDRLYSAGALEVFYTAVQMKKNRPGTLVTIVAPPGTRERITEVLFRDTTTIGLRVRMADRECLAREIVPVATPFGVIRFKIASRDGHVMNAAPEFDDCVRAAAQGQVSPKEVHAAAVQAYREQTARDRA